MTQFDVLTLFPGIFEGFLSESVLKSAIAKGILDVRLHNIREWANDKHHTVDDRPFGGGPGMVMKVDVVVPCVEEILSEDFANGNAISERKPRLILLSPQGKRLQQSHIEELAEQERIVLLCGRYEGFDERVSQLLQPEEVSLGDFVLNGGEVAAMALIEAVMRLLPGALGDEDSHRFDSFSQGNRLLEFPQYTRPREYRGLEVPEILLSGNHGEIEKHRQHQILERTRQRRPDLLEE